MSLGTILLIVLILLLVGAIPSWPHSRSWGYGPSGLLGLVVVVILIQPAVPPPAITTFLILCWSLFMDPPCCLVFIVLIGCQRFSLLSKSARIFRAFNSSSGLVNICNASG